jgi:endonuclease/exonuclease/phosphatase family metal-dependent hydrolase
MTRDQGIVIRALTWNLFHGRDCPPDPSLMTWRSRLLGVTERGKSHAQVNAPLREAFAAWLADRSWELALLQEAPPRWIDALADRCRATAAIALTSRNSLPWLRSLLAEWNPDLIASGEGGSNQLLVRRPARIAEVRRLTLTEAPERRAMLWARVEALDGARVAVANMHLTAGDRPAAARELGRAAERAVEWAGDDPLLLGGDFNLSSAWEPEPFERLRDELGLSEPSDPDAIDHLLARGLASNEPPSALADEERDLPGPGGLQLRLSDHAPVTGTFRLR